MSYTTMNRSSPWMVLLGLLATIYILQLYSPLRTNTDATCFLQMGASASDGLGFTCCKSSQHYPIGYPSLLSRPDRTIRRSSRVSQLPLFSSAFRFLSGPSASP